MNIVLIGIQGSGKGELIKNLAKNMEFTLVSCGALFRKEIKKGSALGKKVDKVMTSGHLVDLKTTMQVVKKCLKENSGNFVFDGFPRTIEQAQELDKICKVDKVIYLNLNKKVAKQRLLNRLTCASCQYITSVVNEKSRTCPVCGGELKTRHDDTEEGINQRFKAFEELTLPVVDKYKKDGVLYEVNAGKSVEAIYKTVLQVLK